MSERPSPEEYRRMEGITPEYEEQAKLGLTEDEEAIERHMAELIDQTIDDRAHPDLLKKVLDEEGITAELERERELRVILKEVARTYHEITKLAKDRTDTLTVEGLSEAGHLWQVVVREWGEYKSKRLTEEQLIGAMKFAYESLLDVFSRMRETM